MNRFVDSDVGLERLWLILRLALLAAACVLHPELVGTPVAIASVVALAVAGLVGFRLVSSVERCGQGGRRYQAALRMADSVAAAYVATNVPDTAANLGALALAPVLFQSLLTSEIRSLVRFLVPLLGAVALLTMFGRADAMIGLLVGAGVVGAAVLGHVLKMYRGRETRLDRRDERLGTALECMAAVATTSDLRSLVLHCLKSATHELSADAGYVMLLDESDNRVLRTETAYSAKGEFEFPFALEIGSGLSGYAVEVRQPVALHGRDESQIQLEGVPESVESALCVPLVARNHVSAGQAHVEQILGAMTLLSTSKEALSDREDLEFMRSLASLVAVTVANVRMEERQQATFLKTLQSLAKSLEARDTYTQGHSERVCELSMMIGDRMGFSPEALEELRIGTILHDIGKIGVPDAILNKRGRLTDEEFDTMRSHPVIGYEICKPLNLSEGVLMIIRNHHEKLDGSGYPDGLKGGELPLSLRVVCVADSFDAMSSSRPYREVMEISKVMAELAKCAGTQFDPVVVEVLRELLNSDRLKTIYRQQWGLEELEAA